MIKHVFTKGPSVTSIPFAKKHVVGGCFLLVVLLLIGSLVYSTLSWMWDDQRLPLSKIVIQGELHYVSDLDVQRAFAQLDQVGTFMSQDVDVLQQAAESIPWVSHAAIRKQWPDTVKVFLTEHHAEAIWNGNFLLNDDGQVFEGDIGKLEQLPVKLYGPDSTSEQVLKVWHDITPKFAALNLTITSLVLNERRAWQIILDNGIRLELGKESLQQRIKRFVSLYKKLGKETQRISYIDLRYDTGAAVGWFPEEQKQERTDD